MPLNNAQWKADQVRRRAALRKHRSTAGDDVGASATRDLRHGRPRVSVIVVCWNAADVLGRCVEHLFAQDYENYEIVVVDDGSDDATVQVAQEASRRGVLRLVQSRRNRGCPSARNLGLRQADGEIVAFIDADGFAATQWLSEVVEAFGEDSSIGGIASTVFFDDNPLVVNGAGGIVNRQGWAADLSMNESYEVAEIASEALYPMGCGMALRREAIERVGPFDERMLNYYDDVDYGTRLWRAGYRVEVASRAWIDHGFGAAGGDSARKQLLCERHRMRVVLKHAPSRMLTRWAAWEARSLRAAAAPVRVQKLRSIAWNLWHLPSAFAGRLRLRSSPRVPDRLVDDSWGDGFPVGVPARQSPAAERAGADLHMGDADAAGLLHGWFPAERVGARGYRWAGPHAAVLVHLDEPAGRLHLDYAHVPVDIGAIDVCVRRIGAQDPLAPAWATRLSWQYISRSMENHPLALAPGDYEVVFRAARGWSDPPQETRSLAFALSRMTLTPGFDIPAGGLEMASPVVEDQLVEGWFEAERSLEHSFRWSSKSAAVVVRLTGAADRVRLRYRLSPGCTGDVMASFTPLGSLVAAASFEIPWRPGDWRDEVFAAQLSSGDYIVRFDVAPTWSNPGQQDRDLLPENRALGFALSALTFD
jgi:GT2 family glycosyltransferase